MAVAEGQMKSLPPAQHKMSCHRGSLATVLKQGARVVTSGFTCSPSWGLVQVDRLGTLQGSLTTPAWEAAAELS